MIQKKIKFMIGAALIVGAIGYLISTSISQTSMYFVTVSELASQGNNPYKGEVIKVKGNVVKGSIIRDPQNYMDVAFSIMDKDSGGDKQKYSLKVVYKGITPDMFIDDGEVVVGGVLEGGVFHANTLLTSCPSKYEAEKEAGKLHPGGLTPYDLKEPSLNKPASMPKISL